MTQPIRLSDRSRDDLDDLLDRLLTTSSWLESKETVEAHPDLLSVVAEERLSVRLQEIPVESDDFLYLIVHQQLLGRCRAAGIDSGFSDLLVDIPVESIFNLLTTLTAPGNTPRRILLTHRLLSTVPLDRLPPLWSTVVDDLGKSLVSTRIGSQDANTERAIFEFCRALSVRTRHEMPQEWSESHCNLATAFRDRIRGDKAENIDKAIALFQQALEVQSLSSTPASFIRMQRLLAEALSWRIRGDREENLELAIEICRNLLRSLSPESDLLDWASVTTDFASYRIDQHAGDPQQRAEEAIEKFERVVAALDPEEFPEEWARAASYLGGALSQRQPFGVEEQERSLDLLEKSLAIQRKLEEPMAGQTAHNLAARYLNRIRGNRAENQKRAIALMEELCRTAEPHRLDRETLNNLAQTYVKLQVGDRPENIERALSFAKQAAEMARETQDPEIRLKVQMTLGSVHLLRARGDREENLEQAADAYEKGLEGASEETPGWAQAKTDLARIYTAWIGPDKNEKIALAVDCCQDALRVRRPEVDRLDWAETVHVLGDAFNWRMDGDRAQNIEWAMMAYRSALEVITPETAPILHLDILNQFAGAFRDRRYGDPEENQRESVRLYQEAVKLAPADVLPASHRAFQGNLGRLHFYRKEWEQAVAALEAALRVSERLYQESSTPEGKLAELREVLEYPPRIAYSLAKLDQPARALEALEENRGRLIAEALDLGEAETRLASKEDRADFDAARRTISDLERDVRNLGLESVEDYVEISGNLRAARQRLAALVERIRSSVPEFLATGLDLPAIAALTRQTGQPLVFLVSSPHGSLALLLSPGEITPEPIWLDGLSSFDLRELLAGGDEDPGFISTVSSGESEHIKAALGRLLPPVETGLIAPLTEALTRRGFHKITLVPCGTLGLLPLPALLGDHLAVSLIPSARAWKSAVDSAAARPDQEPQLLAVSNPEGNLPFASQEIDAIEPLFSSGRSRHFAGRQARRADILAAAPGATCLHFVCHGSYQPMRPLESELALAASETLKVRDLLDGTLDLSTSRLVVLSACESGIFDIRTAPDEVLGFPASFLQAGAPAVISTLWRVSDISTALLLGRFYTLHLKEGFRIAEALRRARLWLRDATAGEMGLADLYQKAYQKTRNNAFAAAKVKYQRRPEEKPFGDPYYWAPFVLHGAGTS